MTFKELYTELILKKIGAISSQGTNQIIVILGQTSLIQLDAISELITERETFAIEGNEKIFNKNWFTKIFSSLSDFKPCHLLSIAQLSYLIHYIDASFFQDRVIIIRDNLRQLFPLEKESFVEVEQREDIEYRPEGLPIYQAEQLVINNKYFFSIKPPLALFKTIDLFEESRELQYSANENTEVINVSSDPYSLDFFVNHCIEEDNFNRYAVVKHYVKQPLNSGVLANLKKFNFVLNQFGGRLDFLEESALAEQYIVKPETNDLLKTFWGDAEFRNISVYKDPNFGNQIQEVSQGLIVDTIINEYENSLRDESVRDLFLTAPTGAGKSLLFQLPAFYVSTKGDVTIVVSPLIALMKDQVNAIIADRKFEKVACINSELSLIDRERIIENCKSREIDILYMSPELLLSYDVTHFIGSRRLGLLVIDEAHLITTWGRDFRVDYWFLGNHIRKIRKYHELRFPMVAVTATAIYGGANDMVFDSIDSLVMQNPHIFIGQVKRDDIEFIVNNYEKYTANYEANKISQTVQFVKQINELGVKTLVYAPFTRHIRQILDQLNAEHLTIAAGYYGSLDSLNKEYAYKQFKSGEKKIMISTKAFGMGVDISDIQIVYHHAPSGLLPDYVQEIGRVARRSDLRGYATLNYSSQDQRYTKALHGMSALRQYQLKEVLKKIFNAYLKNNKNRNLLLSVDDFGHIFQNALDLDQKVLTALMMIEKDYLAKHRFNVIVARPKKLFVKVYARISDNHLEKLSGKYPNSFTLVESAKNGNNIIELDLDKIWYEHFVNKSFPVLKRDFYANNLFKEDKIELVPQLKMSFELFDSFSSVAKKLDSLFNYVQSTFAKTQGFFKEEEFREQLNTYIQDKEKSEKISKFLLSSYSGRLLQPGQIEPHAFLQQRRTIDGFEYRVFSTQYLASLTAIQKRLNILFSGADNTTAERFVTNKEINTIDFVRLGYFLEMLELGTFEIKGGENPMVFVRINDPQRIENDSSGKHYSSSLLSKTLERHSLSNQIFDHFFLRSFTNEERWDFIEDFFLGTDVDILLGKYQGGDTNNVDIIETLKKKHLDESIVDTTLSENVNSHVFHPDPQRLYTLQSLLTIKNVEGVKTKRMSEWLKDDPVSMDQIRRDHNLKITKEVFDILVSKLRAEHPDYFTSALGLHARIIFKGYKRPVKAIVPYKDRPLEFYKWWCSNPDFVDMTFREKVVLFDKVNLSDPSALKIEHRRLINGY